MTTRMPTYLGAPEPFHPAGDDWSLYIERFETYQLLTNLMAPTKPGEHTYAQVKEKLTAHLEPKTIKIVERFRFYKRQQQLNEQMADYIAELCRLATTCKFGTF